jgi:hypothetical protein
MVRIYELRRWDEIMCHDIHNKFIQIGSDIQKLIEDIHTDTHTTSGRWSHKHLRTSFKIRKYDENKVRLSVLPFLYKISWYFQERSAVQCRIVALARAVTLGFVPRWDLWPYYYSFLTFACFEMGTPLRVRKSLTITGHSSYTEGVTLLAHSHSVTQWPSLTHTLSFGTHRGEWPRVLVFPGY